MSKTKILLVDDMAIITEIIISYLAPLSDDFEFHKALNGREACKMARQIKPKLIIMDWEMPKMNGIEALNFLKKNDRTKDIPVIISSAFSESENVQIALEAGAIDYIRKPINEIEIIARVRSVLALYSSFDLLKKKQEELESERQKTESILQLILPKKILTEIRKTGTSKPIRYKNATVLFADLVDFTEKTIKMSPKRLINELNDIFSEFDDISKKNNCTRVKTIGDAYLSVCGLPDENKNHADLILKSAIEFQKFLFARNKTSQIRWELRIGLHSGDVIGSIVGKKNFLFDIFGENVNIAARIQNHCPPTQICLSETTHKHIDNKYPFLKCEKPILKGVRPLNIFSLKITDLL